MHTHDNINHWFYNLATVDKNYVVNVAIAKYNSINDCNHVYHFYDTIANALLAIFCFFCIAVLNHLIIISKIVIAIWHQLRIVKMILI